MGLLVLAVGGAALALNVYAKDSPAGPFAGQPLPPLFPRDRVTIVERIAAPEQARAVRDFGRWEARHPARDDAAFSSFALTSVGPPPTGRAQRHELAVLHRIDAHRTPAGIAASVWLEAHGNKDVWKLYRKQYQSFVSPAAGSDAKATFKATYALGNALEAQGKAHFARVSPYIADPTLHALNQNRFAKKFSYPSKHTLVSYALMGVLSQLEPQRSAEYRWMSDEISYSRLYAGGHYPSDVAAGAYLGTLVAQYELHLSAPSEKG